MGKRGPPRTPTAILKLHGSHRAASREGNEPKPKAAKPRASIKLSAIERRVFNTACGLVESMGLQAATDGNALARYAKNVVRYNAACEFIEKHGESYAVYDRHNDGTKTIRMMKRFPESFLRNELESTLLRLEQQFGLTPAARASLETDTAQETNATAKRFFG